MINYCCHHASKLSKADGATVAVAAMWDDKTLLKVPATVTTAVPALAYCAAMQLYY
jgi:hypothetical protein